jgi:hypothetical protein
VGGIFVFKNGVTDGYARGKRRQWRPLTWSKRTPRDREGAWHAPKTFALDAQMSAAPSNESAVEVERKLGVRDIQKKLGCY